MRTDGTGGEGWERRQRFAVAMFTALEMLDDIAALDRDETGAGGIGFDALYRYATEPDQPLSPALSSALRNGARLRADLRHLLARSARFSAPVLAAASSGTITTRHGAGFALTLRESRADREQIYVIIRFDESLATAPTTLFVIAEHRDCRKLALPSPTDSTIQLLVEAGSELVSALRDPRTEVFIR